MFGRGAFEQKIIFCLKWSKRVQMGPKGVPNGQKHLDLPFRTILDLFGPLWNVDQPDMLRRIVCFIGAFFGDTPYFLRP